MEEAEGKYLKHVFGSDADWNEWYDNLQPKPSQLLLDKQKRKFQKRKQDNNLSMEPLETPSQNTSASETDSSNTSSSQQSYANQWRSNRPQVPPQPDTMTILLGNLTQFMWMRWLQLFVLVSLGTTTYLLRQGFLLMDASQDSLPSFVSYVYSLYQVQAYKSFIEGSVFTISPMGALDFGQLHTTAVQASLAGLAKCIFQEQSGQTGFKAKMKMMFSKQTFSRLCTNELFFVLNYSFCFKMLAPTFSFALVPELILALMTFSEYTMWICSRIFGTTG